MVNVTRDVYGEDNKNFWIAAILSLEKANAVRSYSLYKETFKPQQDSKLRLGSSVCLMINIRVLHLSSVRSELSEEIDIWVTFT